MHFPHVLLSSKDAQVFASPEDEYRREEGKKK